MNYFPLGEVAQVREVLGLSQISREDGKRWVFVSANVVGRDLASLVEDIQARVRSQVGLPPSYWIEYGGSIEQLIWATERLQIVVPMALLIIFALLMMAFSSVRDAVLVFSGVPMTLTE